MSLFTYLQGVPVGVSSIRLRADGYPGPQITGAADGTGSQGSIVFDDPTGSLTVTGWQSVVVDEPQCTAAPRLFTGYVAERTYRRGPYHTGAGREIDTTLNDLNALLSLRLIVNSDGKRPRETEADRFAWLFASPYLNGLVADLGLVDASSIFYYDEGDFRDQYPADVIAEMAQTRGLIFFVYYDQTTHSNGLFFDDPTSTTYTSTLTLSNVLTDITYNSSTGVVTGTCFPAIDAELEASPEDVVSRIKFNYKGGYVIRNNLTTAGTFFPSPLVTRGLSVTDERVGLLSTATTFADRLLARYSQEQESITCTVRLPADKVGLIDAGHRISVRFTHLPGFSNFAWTRVERKSIVQSEGNPDYYEVTLTLSTRGLTGAAGTGGGSTDPFPHPTSCPGTPTGGVPTIIQKDAVGSPSGSPSPLTATFPSPPTPGNEIIAIHSTNLPVTPTWPAGYTQLTIIDQTTGLPWVGPASGIAAAVKTVASGEGSTVTVSNAGVDRSTLLVFEVSAGTFNGGTALYAAGPTLTGIVPTVTTTTNQTLLIASAAYLNSGFPSSPPSGWTMEDNTTFGLAGANSLLTPAFSRLVTPAGTYGGETYTITLSGADISTVVFDFEPCDADSSPPAPGVLVPWTVVTLTGAVGTTAFPYAPGSLEVKVDGVLISPASYTETDPGAGTFTLSWTPDTDEVVIVQYLGI